MKKLFLLFVLSFAAYTSIAAQVVVEEEVEVFLWVEQQPEFPGGEAEMEKFIKKNIIYPPMAKEISIQGKVWIDFTIDRTGSVVDVKIFRGIGGGCDEEAVRVVKNMPKWNPGKANGRAVNVKYRLPIKFVLN